VTQLDLDGGQRILGLTARQQIALEALERAADGLTADELGAVLHERAGRHYADQRCEWCTSDGRQVARALRTKHLTVRRKTGYWQSLRKPPDRLEPLPRYLPDPPPHTQTEEIPF
jgi:hypothetical protein